MRILVLTDHSGHTVNNSLYGVVRHLVDDKRVVEVRIACRGSVANNAFFSCSPSGKTRPLAALVAAADFTFEKGKLAFASEHSLATPLAWADAVWLRIPHPVPGNWFNFLREAFGKTPIINRPEGIELTTSKRWLLEVPELCAPTALCERPEEVAAFAKTRPCVLKPLEGYGGKGILRADEHGVYVDDHQVSFAHWPAHPLAQQPYLAVEFLTRVSEGDKRIVVLDGEVLGAVLRVPKPGNWLANVSQGGHAEPATLSFAERRIVETLRPKLRALGVVMYGIDTLMGNEGERVLSEVNTMSIGGLNDLPAFRGQSATQYTASKLVDLWAVA